MEAGISGEGGGERAKSNNIRQDRSGEGVCQRAATNEDNA